MYTQARVPEERNGNFTVVKIESQKMTMESVNILQEVCLKGCTVGIKSSMQFTILVGTYKSRNHKDNYMEC